MMERNFVRFIAGAVVTLSVIGGHFIHYYLYAVTLFAGLNLLQSSITGFCPPEKIYSRFLD